MLEKFKWYIKRLKVMDYREVMYRLYEYYEKNIILTQYITKSGICSSKTFVFSDFEFPKKSGRCFSTLKWYDVPSLDKQGILDGKHLCFSWEWKWHDSADIWHISLENGNKWPKDYYSKIAYRQGNKTGDLRLVWEPSRLQQLVNLSLLIDDEDERFVEKISQSIVQQFEHWDKNNPTLIGVHYISSMECSLRLISVIIAFDNIRNCNYVKSETWNTLLGFVWKNAEYVSKRISLYSSAGNHTIAECSGLLFAAILFPEFKEASQWKAVAEKILFKEFKRQINDEGGSIEQAFCYQVFILDLFGLIIKLYESHKLVIPNDLLVLHKKSCMFLNSLSSNIDELPNVGDSDNGYALSKYLNIIWEERHFDEGLTVFEKTGYSVINNTKINQQILFDHGSLGMPPSYGHGHADALSIVLRSGDNLVLIDPGTYTYTGDLEWRKYFRGTRAHNTVIVNGLDQSKQETAFMWTKPYVSKVKKISQEAGGIIKLLAYHDGYKELGICHWRGIVVFPEGHIFVWDFIDGKNKFDLELNWHLGVGFEKIDNIYILQTSSGIIRLSVDGGIADISEGLENPIIGWNSPKYGFKNATSTLTTKCHTELPAKFITKILVGDEIIADEVIEKEISVFEGWIT